MDYYYNETFYSKLQEKSNSFTLIDLDDYENIEFLFDRTDRIFFKATDIKNKKDVIICYFFKKIYKQPLDNVCKYIRGFDGESPINHPVITKVQGIWLPINEQEEEKKINLGI